MRRVPVYMTSLARQDPIRRALAWACLSFWTRHREVESVTILVPSEDAEGPEILAAAWAAFAAEWSGLLAASELKRLSWIQVSLDGSQRERHVIAASLASEAGATYYVATDDDCLPRPEASVATALDLMDQYPDYGMVCLTLPNCYAGRHDARPGGAISGDAPSGGVRFCRAEAFHALLARGFPPARPQEFGGGFDIPLWEGLRACGYKVGVFGDASPPSLRATHLAETGPLTTVWRRTPIQGFPVADD